MTLDRRSFLAAGAGVAAGAALTGCATSPTGGVAPAHRPVIVSTWPFGKAGNERAREVILGGRSVLDGIEQGVRQVEARGPDGSVGVKGRPNAAGYTQVDACIIDGNTHKMGSVAGVEGIIHPISAARLVMEKTKHVMLVGEGARWFALENGLDSIDVSASPAKKAAWRAGQRNTAEKGGHDTIAMVALGAGGEMAGGCSTSGAAGKLPGRVGDSPILGSGLYVDAEAGAAGATGIGENVMRYCATFMIVELMRSGMDPTAACETAIHRIARWEGTYKLDICFIALDPDGRVGAASSNSAFPFAVTTRDTSEVRRVAKIQPV